MANSIKTSDFQYLLPDERIAKHPLVERDQSKLLYYRKGKILHHRFDDLPTLLPSNATLFFNNTRVIPARLLFQKESGAQIEVLLLNPVDQDFPFQLALQTQGSTRWKCTIGNLKRWKKDGALTLTRDGITLDATLVDPQLGVVDFKWKPATMSFAEIVEVCGQTPLPPYLHRDVEPNDKIRYQTVYSRFEGAVAAPTAGLHFTDAVLGQLASKSIKTEYLTLHVSAGTFQPIKGEDALDHTMHAEQVIVTRANLTRMLEHDRQLIAVGTTSMRTMESLYWYGVKLLNGGPQHFEIKQDDPYQLQSGRLPSREEALRSVVATLDGDQPLIGNTSIYIVPGYQFRVCDGLITNFHQPGSTLMLLVAAFIGENWKRIYDAALGNDYRFLSYGDSSLLIP